MLLYDGTVELEFNEANHRYKVNGQYKEGVTSLLKILNKDGLLQWAANMATTYIKDNCKDGKVYIVLDEDLAKAKYAHLNFRDAAADVGKQVHKWIELYIDGSTTSFTAEMAPSIEAFLRWEAWARPEYLFSERVCYSKEYDYCGTTDVVMMLDGMRTILDFKTGKAEEDYNPRSKRYSGKIRPRTEHLIQDAFYDIAITEEDGVAAEQYAVLYLPQNGNVQFLVNDNVGLYKQMALSVLSTARLHKACDQDNQFRDKEESTWQSIR